MDELQKAFQLLEVLQLKEKRQTSCVILNLIQRLAETTLKIQTKFPQTTEECNEMSNIIEAFGDIVKQFLGLQTQKEQGIFD